MTTNSIGTMNSASSDELDGELRGLIFDYLAEPLVHGKLAHLLWGEELEQLKNELTGSIRVRARAHRAFNARTCTRIRREEDHYLDELPRFTQDSVRRHHPVMMGKNLPVGFHDIYLRGGWSFRYRTVITHLDRPFDAAPPLWAGTVTVLEEEANVVHDDDRTGFEIGAFVVTRLTPLADIAMQVRLFRRLAPKVRLALIWAARSDWLLENFARQEDILVLRPGPLFGTFCEHRDEPAPSGI